MGEPDPLIAGDIWIGRAQSPEAELRAYELAYVAMYDEEPPLVNEAHRLRREFKGFDPYVAIVDGSIEAAALVEQNDENIATLGALATTAKYRGTGLGYTMLSTIELLVATQGSTELQLLNSNRALDFYLRQGYEFKSYFVMSKQL